MAASGILFNEGLISLCDCIFAGPRDFLVVVFAVVRIVLIGASEIDENGLGAAKRIGSQRESDVLV